MSKYPYMVLLWDLSKCQLHPAYHAWLANRQNNNVPIDSNNDLMALRKLGIKASRNTRNVNNLDNGDEYVLIRNQNDELIWSHFCLEWTK